MQIWAESGKSALPICNYSQILYQFLTFTQNLKRSHDFSFFHSPPRRGDGDAFAAKRRIRSMSTTSLDVSQRPELAALSAPIASIVDRPIAESIE